MRILLICHEYPPIGGGAAAVCAALGREYARQGHATWVVTMGFDDLPDRECVDDVRVIRVPCGRQSKTMASAREGLRWAKAAWPVVRDLHQSQNFQMAHAHFVMPAGIVARRLYQSAAVPFLITPHGSDVPGYNRERLKLVHYLVRPWWKQIVKSANAVVSPSHDLLALLCQSVTVPQSQVIPNGFEPGRFKPLEKENRILLCSRLVARKGFDVFLRAIQNMPLFGWHVDIVGDGPQREVLSQLAQQCRVPVHMHGWIDNDDPRLAELHGKARIYVLPSERENFSIALLEAMSAGCAVITTNVAGNPEVVGDTGYLMPPRDETMLAQVVEELTANPMLCNKLGQRAAQRACEQFNWMRIGEQYLKVMASIVNGNSQPPGNSTCVSV